MRRRYWILGSIALGGAVALAFGVPALAHRALRAELARRGFEGDAESLRFSPGGVEARGLVAVAAGGKLRVAPRRVFVELDYLRMRPEEILIEGGTLELVGGLDELRRALPKDEPAAREADSSNAQRFVTVRELEVRWETPFGAGSRAEFGNVQLDRGPGGTKFGSDLVTLSRGDVRLRAAGVVLDLGSGAGGTRIDKATAAEVHIGTASPRADVAGADSGASDETPEALPNWLLVDEGRAGKLKELLERLRSELLPRLPERAEIRRVSFELGEGDAALHLGPSALVVDGDAERVRFSLTPDEVQSERKLALVLSVTRGPGPAELSLRGGPVSLADLGVRSGQLGLTRVEEASLSGDGRVLLEPNAERIEASGRVEVSELTVEGRGLAPGPVSLPRLVLEGKLEAEISGATLRLAPATLAVGETSLKLSLDWTRKESVLVDATAKVPLVSCQALLHSAPAGMLGEVADVRMRGTFSLDAALHFDSRALSKAKVELDARGDCEVSSVPGSLDPARFRRAFPREVEGPAGEPFALEFGPTTSAWASRAEIPPVFEKALLVTEDGRFFRHGGFDPRAIESSIIDNVKAGRFVRGASTISMQLAKNLYLGREKQLSRKLRELVLTLVLEQSFDKKELLELYANVVELGPFVYGIRAAAQYYFGALPQDLTVAQTFFLASILPNPKKNHFDRTGALARGALTHVHRLLDVALARKLLTAEEVERAKKEELVFGRPSTSPAEVSPPVDPPVATVEPTP